MIFDDFNQSSIRIILSSQMSTEETIQKFPKIDITKPRYDQSTYWGRVVR